VEDLVSGEFWRGKRVLITGHTGFKGGWLALWLKALGAEVSGFRARARHPSEPL
jgi:CDP-glucose 4,6-dehydratase